MIFRKWFVSVSQALLVALAWQIPSLAAAGDLKIPRHGKSLQSFVPPGYKIGITVSADFNGDGKEDIAALLWVSPDSTKTRPLIILLAQAGGAYRLSARLDHFTITEEDDCGGGNFYCVPRIRANGRALVIDMPWGSAAGYEVYENEFQLIGSTWYQVRQSDYYLGLNLTCPESDASREDERCVEQGISKDLQTGIATDYSKFVDDDGKETRSFRTESTFSRIPLRHLSEAKWESIEQ